MSIISGNTVKIGAIAVLTGYCGYLLYSPIRGACILNQGGLTDFLCLRASNFFRPGNIDDLLQINIPNLLMQAVFKFGLPINSLLNARSCKAFANVLVNKLDQVANVMAQEPISYYARCCLVPTLKQTALLSFGEELIYRKLIQNWALLKIAKLAPVRYRQFLSESTTRIFLTSMLFAINHYERGRPLLPEFITGVILGAVYEKYGVIAATVSHFVTNLHIDLFTRNSCDTTIPTILRELDNRPRLPDWSFLGKLRCIGATSILDIFGISPLHPCANPS